MVNGVKQLFKSVTLSLNAKFFGKDEKSRDQSIQVNN